MVYINDDNNNKTNMDSHKHINCDEISGGLLNSPGSSRAEFFFRKFLFLPICRKRAEEITEEEGLSSLVDFHVGDALRMPFPAAQFDFLWAMESLGTHPTEAIANRRVQKVS